MALPEMAAPVVPPETDVPPGMGVQVPPEMTGAIKAILGAVPTIAAAMLSLAPDLRPLAMPVLASQRGSRQNDFVYFWREHFPAASRVKPLRPRQPGATCTR
jgi:hypothetical protein